MLTLFKKLFGKSKATVVAPAQPVAVIPSAPMPTVEVVHLSLAAIVGRLPEDMRPLLASEPDAVATVALPLPTILKQLATGCVKMSLGTLQRQAHGVIKPLPVGDKRTVDVPLGEVFRHVRLDSLKRRADQRPVCVPETGFNLFSDASKPYAMVPDDHLEQTQLADLAPEPAAAAPVVSSAPRVLKMDDGLRQHFSGTTAARPAEPALNHTVGTTASSPRVVAVPSGLVAPKSAAAAPVAKPAGATLALKLSPLAANWPDNIRAEIAALDPATTVALPVDDVTAGLAKGRVAFSWAQIHAWLEPAPAPTNADGTTALQLPLKIVAPAFLSGAKKPATERKTVAMDESIPALFADARAPEPQPEPAPEPEPELAQEPEAEAAPEAAEPVAVPQDSGKIPETVGELFGQPHKQNWTPAEIVSGTVKLPGVAGAVVALQEGLQVAAALPDGVKSDVVAAFLPQIFARLNQYASEMRLGEVDDLLFTTHGAHCQIYRLGYIYLAVLGKPGESLPWHELRLISEELARQTHK
jgi:predicted regulator of Ras-like GTPase activity (Roadblock/LC7/MglB family)